METLRDRRRSEFLDEVPTWYRSWLHLLALNGTLVLGTGFGLYLLDGGGGLAWLTLPVLFVAANAFEWRAHRDWLHKRTRGVEILYEQHTIQHHTLFVRGDMTWGDEPGLLRAILVPPFSGVLVVVAVMPIAAGLWFLLGRNVALVFELGCLWYFCSYEWLHLLCHVDEASWLGRRRLVRAMARHHSLHHEPRLMQKYNFNVNFPLWDWVRGSFAPKALIAEIEADRDAISDRRMAA